MQIKSGMPKRSMVMSVWAMATRCLMPPDNSVGYLSLASERRMSSRYLRAISLACFHQVREKRCNRLA